MVWPCSVTSCGLSSARRTWTSGWLWRSSRGHTPRAGWPPGLQRSTRSSSPPVLDDRYLLTQETPPSGRSTFDPDFFLQINVDSAVRESTSQSLSVGLSPASFQLAQDQIFSLMESDSYPRFLRSRLYNQLANQGRASMATSGGSTSVRTDK